MKQVIKGLKFALKYGGIIIAVVEIMKFAISKFENFDMEISDEKEEVKPTKD